MKKLVLTSLLAVFAATGANAAINDNPMYRPDQGKFYSVTGLHSSTDTTNAIALTENFGYGITDRLSINLATSLSEANWFDQTNWNSFGVGLNYRVFDGANWKADVFGAYSLNPIWGYGETFLGEDFTTYNWKIGAVVGYETGSWTFAGHAIFDYENSESFNWGDDGFHTLKLGADTFFAMNSNWSLLLGAEYNADLDNWEDNTGYWTGKLGVNYNIDDAKFVGAYVGKEMTHEGEGAWKIQDGFAYGVMFGVEF